MKESVRHLLERCHDLVSNSPCIPGAGVARDPADDIEAALRADADTATECREKGADE